MYIILIEDISNHSSLLSGCRGLVPADDMVLVGHSVVDTGLGEVPDLDDIKLLERLGVLTGDQLDQIVPLHRHEASL